MYIDDEHWRPFEGRYPDGFPLVGAISKLASDEKQSIEFPWCLHVTVHFDHADGMGFPTSAENESVRHFAESVLAQLRAAGRVIEAARLTGHGGREFWWYVGEPEPMHDILAEMALQPELYRAFDYDITLDADWDEIEQFT